jgi:hypothetical protein
MILNRQLNLPPFNYRVKEISGHTFIYDFIRNRYMRLYPEEWVRQHFINYLINHLGYPKSMIALEASKMYLKQLRRADITVYNKLAQVFMLVECKSYEIKLSNDHIKQLSMYNANHKCDFLVLTNGMQNVCLKLNSKENFYKPINYIPVFCENTDI